MVNLTLDRVVFNMTADALDAHIRAALKLAADTSLAVYGLEHVDMEAVTTHQNIRAAFAKFVRFKVLADQNRILGEEYAQLALEAYRQPTGHVSQQQFNGLMFPDITGALVFKRTYAKLLRMGLGLFLIALHSSRAVTLPSSFSWPIAREDGVTIGGGRRKEIGKFVSSELLAFIRELDPLSASIFHPAFSSVGNVKKTKDWFLAYGTRLLLATGWHTPEDVNLEDLLKIKVEEGVNWVDKIHLPYKMLLDVLKLRFGDRVKPTVEEWSNAVRAEMQSVALYRGRRDSRSFACVAEEQPRADQDLLDELLHIDSAWGRPERMRGILRLPGLDVDITELSGYWLQLEELYIKKTARENYKPILNILGWWNVYLFFYLPNWFARNPATRLTYPRIPSLLLKSAFVSRLLTVPEEMPLTFIEFMNRHSEHRGWKGNGLSGNLYQLQGFFEFIERNSEELLDCEGFRQPLSPYDYPPTTSSKATKKQPIPRRLFGLYLDYHEALIAHHRVVTSRVLSCEIDGEHLKRRLAVANVIDTFASADLVGFVPVLFTKTTTIPLKFIPNVLDLDWRTLRDGRSVYLPHPHALNQNLVSLHTGIRHNHIQWLDRERFDSLLDDDELEFARLFVNTDKQKKEPWAPYVSMRVIELLRAQREWSELIGEDGFDASHYYNNNPSTKWPKFRPLFAYASNGKPHNDSLYSNTWQSVLCGLQGLFPELAELGHIRPLLRLLPPGCRTDDPGLEKALKTYGAQFGMGECCRLNVMTASTPHSARVAVVTQYITFLPTDLIGQYITGQKPSVVQYYVHLDKEAIEVEQVQHAQRLREAALRNAFEPVVNGPHASSSFIHADRINSNLAKSLRVSREETLVAYGCISITFSERSANGLDVFRKTHGIDAIANKTEICPYGNNCPPEVIKELRGMRRCSLCHFAVRSVDHLPAIIAKW